MFQRSSIWVSLGAYMKNLVIVPAHLWCCFTDYRIVVTALPHIGMVRDSRNMTAGPDSLGQRVAQQHLFDIGYSAIRTKID